MNSKVEDLIKSWDNIQFVAYLYICIGKSDYSLVDEEISEIIEKLSGKLPPKETREAYDEALKVYNIQSDTEIINFIKLHTKDFFINDDDRKKVLQDLEDIMEADGIIKDVEMIMYRFIKKTLA